MSNEPMLSVGRKVIEDILADAREPGTDYMAARKVLRALLDKPESFELVEPVAPWFYFVECDDPDYSALFNHESEAQTQANDHGGHVVRLWNVPPTWKPAAQYQGEPVACASCDGSGDVVDGIGDWRGYCACPAGVALKLSVYPESEELAPKKTCAATLPTPWEENKGCPGSRKAGSLFCRLHQAAKSRTTPGMTPSNEALSEMMRADGFQQ